jgi:lipopolysaccharide/colanic/teichoic acid biosynthesis glycosyltransferase
MTKLGNIVEFKIAPVQSLSVIGSPYRNKKGELYTFDVQFKLNESLYRRQKRLLDIVLSVVSLLLIPLFVIKGKNLWKMTKQFLSILLGRHTWIGYCSDQAYQQLPKIKPGIFPPAQDMPLNHDQQARLQIDFFYAKDYSVFLDLKLIFNHLFRL